MRYRFIEQERPNYAVSLLCRVMQVSRSGLYAWRRRPKSERAKQDEALTERIKVIHAQSRGLYGAHRLHAELRDQEVSCGKKRVARLMRSAGLRGKCKGESKQKRRKTDPPTANNLLGSNFNAARPNAVWVSDIIYLRTQEGWLYLAVVLDAFSRRVVGWAMQTRMTTSLTLAALGMACQRRLPERASGSRNARQYERELPGERCCRELFRHAQDGRGAGTPLPDEGAGEEVRVRLPGGVL